LWHPLINSDKGDQKSSTHCYMLILWFPAGSKRVKVARTTSWWPLVDILKLNSSSFFYYSRFSKSSGASKSAASSVIVRSWGCIHKKLLWHWIHAGKRVSGSLQWIQVELKKHRGKKLSKGIPQGTNISLFYSNFAILIQRNHCIFSFSNKPFHFFCIGESQARLLLNQWSHKKSLKSFLWILGLIYYPCTESDPKSAGNYCFGVKVASRLSWSSISFETCNI
jgi:hypothetical protein